MAPNNLNEFLSFVNQQMLSIEDLNEHLSKASALMQIALCHNFSDFPEKTIHDYLWVLSDIIQNAYTCSAHSLKDVFTANRIVNTTIASKSIPKETNT